MQHKRKALAGYLIVGAVLVLALLWSLWRRQEASTDQPRYYALSGGIFHTFYHIKYNQEVDYHAQVDSTFAAFSHSLNPFDSTSLISAINRNTSVYADSMLQHVWRGARAISEASGGSYDVTCSPLINAWGFGFESMQEVTPEVIDSLRSFVGYEGVRLSGDSLLKRDPRMIFDFSSISKGYCSDLVGQMLMERGATSYMVEIGGEIAFRGKNPQGKAWTAGINKPIEDASGFNQELELIINLDRPYGGLATSGNYRNYKVVDGKKVAHTIDPHTGYPIQTDVLSATIIAPSCMMADGLATACMTMPSAQVPKFLSAFSDVDYLLILAGENGGFITKMSDGFRALIAE